MKKSHERWGALEMPIIPGAGMCDNILYMNVEIIEMKPCGFLFHYHVHVHGLVQWLTYYVCQ